MTKWYRKKIIPGKAAAGLGLDPNLWECVGDIVPGDAIKDLAIAFGLEEDRMREFFTETQGPVEGYLKEN